MPLPFPAIIAYCREPVLFLHQDVGTHHDSRRAHYYTAACAYAPLHCDDTYPTHAILHRYHPDIPSILSTDFAIPFRFAPYCERRFVIQHIALHAPPTDSTFDGFL